MGKPLFENQEFTNKFLEIVERKESSIGDQSGENGKP
jgi:hypothetical protein